MNATKALRAAPRTPLIKFIGKRSAPESIDHTPTAHPASPSDTLPDSFATYRAKAQQHGPLNSGPQSTSGQSSKKPESPSLPQSIPYGAIGGTAGRSLGKVEAPEGVHFDRSELPSRFARTPWTQAEIDAIETGGASLLG